MDKKLYTRTDLAAESATDPKTTAQQGVSVTESDADGFHITTVKITDKSGEELIGKPIGSYVTVNVGRLWLDSGDAVSRAADTVADMIARLTETLVGKKDLYKVLVAGLGNRYITSDSIGPLTVKGINVTSHVKKLDPQLFGKLGRHSISAVSPGVSGQTGIETVKLIKNAVQSVSPDVVIAVDALAAKSTDRLGTTLQLCDTGISPGSGIGNLSQAINEETLGVPVIAIGVPTMVSSSTLVYDALEKGGITSISESVREVLDNGKSFFVTLNETDIAVSTLAALISSAIDKAFTLKSETA